MKKIYARVVLALDVTDEEFAQLRDGKTDPMSNELAQRFVEQGELLKDGDSYIPEDWWDDFGEEWL